MEPYLAAGVKDLDNIIICPCKDTNALQCSGTDPCTTCVRRSFTCTFSNAPSSADRQSGTTEHNARPPKRKFQSLEIPQTTGRGSVHVRNFIASPKDPATEDETPIENPGRLLQDGGGRLCNYCRF